MMDDVSFYRYGLACMNLVLVIEKLIFGCFLLLLRFPPACAFFWYFHMLLPPLESMCLPAPLVSQQSPVEAPFFLLLFDEKPHPHVLRPAMVEGARRAAWRLLPSSLAPGLGEAVKRPKATFHALASAWRSQTATPCSGGHRVCQPRMNWLISWLSQSHNPFPVFVRSRRRRSYHKINQPISCLSSRPSGFVFKNEYILIYLTNKFM